MAERLAQGIVDLRRRLRKTPAGGQAARAVSSTAAEPPGPHLRTVTTTSTRSTARPALNAARVTFDATSVPSELRVRVQDLQA